MTARPSHASCPGADTITRFPLPGALRLAITRTQHADHPVRAAPNGIRHTVAAAHSVDQVSVHSRIGLREAGQTLPVAALEGICETPPVCWNAKSSVRADPKIS
jgi:hypothetical protein